MPEWAPEVAEVEIVGPEASETPLVQDLQPTANSAGEIDTKLPDRKREGYFIPSHGGGLLKRNSAFPPDMVRPGPGPSPTAKLRDEMRKGLQDLLPRVIRKANKGEINELAVADFLAKYGIGTTGTVTIVSPDVISRLEKQAMLIASRPSWDSSQLLTALRDIWA